MIDRKPAIVARPLGVADVVTCVRWARQHDVRLTIKGGGHNIAGLAVADDALTLDMSAMRGVWVDTDANVAHAQAGCLLGDVDRETQVHGLAAVLGFVSATGIAGLTLGGGFGYMTRKYGWTSDNVLSIQVVTADGRVVRASEKENPDLFWGLRGGGGNFGIATDFEYRLYPVGPEVMAGAIAWRGDDTAQVLELYEKVTANAPSELTCPLVLRNAPPAPWLDRDVHGKPVTVILFAYSGSVEEGAKLAQPLKSFGSPVGDVIQPRPYTTIQSLLDGTQPKGRRYYWKSEYVPGVETELLTKAAEHARKTQSPHSAVIVFPLDGALGRLPEDHSAVGNRATGAVINIAGSWDDAAEDRQHIAWARDTWSDMRRFSTGGTYMNFLTEEEGDARIRDAYGSNYDRLIDVKTTWDPDNFFSVNKNVVPRG
ncbi:MAG: FAD-binding oxidoreductase [bacterium]|nr:FAD-binding oxidoreductase [bacterium]